MYLDYLYATVESLIIMLLQHTIQLKLKYQENGSLTKHSYLVWILTLVESKIPGRNDWLISEANLLKLCTNCMKLIEYVLRENKSYYLSNITSCSVITPLPMKTRILSYGWIVGC